MQCESDVFLMIRNENVTRKKIRNENANGHEKSMWFLCVEKKLSHINLFSGQQKFKIGCMVSGR